MNVDRDSMSGELYERSESSDVEFGNGAQKKANDINVINVNVQEEVEGAGENRDYDRGGIGQESLCWKICATFASVLVLALTIALVVSVGRIQSLQQQQTVGVLPTPGALYITILAVNDVYEMSPTANEGGLPRLATLKKTLLKDNPDTYMVLAGDLWSPSAIGTAVVNGSAIAGAQMQSCMNSMLDVATFGNHEMDLSETNFYARLQESKNVWVVSNIESSSSNPAFTDKVVPTHLITAKNGLRVGFYGGVTSMNPRPYVKIYNQAQTLTAMQTAIDSLKKQGADIVIALTHFSLDEDLYFLANLKGVDIIVGGHEHQNYNLVRNSLEKYVGVFKADSNAHSAYQHNIYFDPTKPVGSRVSTVSKLLRLDSSIASDEAMTQLTDSWIAKAYVGFRADGFEPTLPVVTLTETLNAMSIFVRSQPSRVGQLVAQAITAAAASYNSDFTMINSGLMRLDDIMLVGSQLLVYDVLRLLPYKNIIQITQIPGSVLAGVMAAGAVTGAGSYLVYDKVTASSSTPYTFTINGVPLDTTRTYTVATTDFVLSASSDTVLLRNWASKSTVTSTNVDTRQAFINKLKATYPNA